MTTYAVTGATGQLGSLAIEKLISNGVRPGDIVAVARDSAKAQALSDRGVTVRIADYAQPEALSNALTRVDRLLLVSGSEIGQRFSQHRNVIDAAHTAGVSFIAYTSLLRADTTSLSLGTEHRETEKYLAESTADYAILRNGWYSENYASSYPAALATGTFYGAAGNGLVAPAARSDYARAAVIALTTPEPGRIYELAGSEHLGYADIAALFSDIAGKDISYVGLSESDYAQALIESGLPEPVAHMLADSDAGVARGDLDSDSGDLLDLVGALTPFTAAVSSAVSRVP